MKTAMAELSSSAPDSGKTRGFDRTALGALFVLTLRQHLRGRRLLVLSLLFVLPTILAIVVRLSYENPPLDPIAFALVFNLIPHALVPLTALLYAAGLIQDEVEEQTLAYLLLRPLPRWTLYLTRLAATVLVTVGLTVVFTTLALVVLYWNTPQWWPEVFPHRVLQAAALLALAQLAYCAVFGLLGLGTRRALVAGLVYIAIFEGLLASFDWVVRRLTVMYYFRVLAMRWLALPDNGAWALDLATDVSVRTCILTLLGASAAFAVAGAVLMMQREFRMKTPEGS